MYSTCLFCNSALGANESIEHFPVGRRLAYDAKVGRLWVVCRKCERWNLSPLESRWEAIEECERAFRGTKLRVSTDNIGLAQLKEGTELVRIGAPLRQEFAAWRYGDQFGKRQRKFVAITTAGFVGMLVPSTVQLLLVREHFQSLWPVWSAMGVGFATQIATGFQRWRHKAIPRLIVRDEKNRPYRLTHSSANFAKLHGNGKGGAWELKLQHVDVKPSGPIARRVGAPEVKSGSARTLILRGQTALNALGVVLPHLNHGGGSKKSVQEAVEIIETFSDVDEIIAKAAGGDGIRDKRFYSGWGNHIVQLPTRARLAMEMSLHETDERRALEGELLQLEQRWRDADEIAKIADSLLIPRDIDEQMNELHRRDRK